MSNSIDSSFQNPISGSINALNGTVDLLSPNSATTVVQLSGTWVGTLVIEASNNGSTYVALPCVNETTREITSSVITNGAYVSITNGYQFYRLRASAWTSGTVSVSAYGSDAISNVNAQSTVRFPNDYTTGSFGALRVVYPQNIFESLFSFDKQTTVWDETTSGGATSTFNSNTNSVDMTLPTTSGAGVVRQTFRRIRYNPSRTVQMLAAGTLGTPKTNVRRRIGQFDASDGMYFELDGTTAYVVRRTSTSGSVVNNRVAQTDWNIDKFDGTGPSGITIDFSKQHLFYIQYAFQGFGDIVYGFYSNGKIKFCHREAIANVLSVPAMKTAHLPCRVEITNTGTSASSTTMSYNSFCVKNEGVDANFEGQVRSYSNAPLKTINTTLVPVISVRLGPGFEKAIADIIKTSIYVNTADEVIWSLHLNPTLTGATFAITASYTQLDIAATDQSGGIELDSGILTQSNSSGQVSQDVLKLINSYLGVSITGTPVIITLSARNRQGAADILSSLVWREYP